MPKEQDGLHSQMNLKVLNSQKNRERVFKPKDFLSFLYERYICLEMRSSRSCHPSHALRTRFHKKMHTTRASHIILHNVFASL